MATIEITVNSTEELENALSITSVSDKITCTIVNNYPDGIVYHATSSEENLHELIDNLFPCDDFYEYMATFSVD